jgi:very-short-patch-repair endonuclease
MNNNYDLMTEQEKQDIIHRLYGLEKKSFQDIAVIYNTYANKIRRDAKKFNISIRNKSDAQKNALSTGKHKHPTKGQQRTDETKAKIGKQIMDLWDNMGEQELNQRKQKAKENWDNLSYDQKQLMKQQANSAVRTAGKVGSKLERFVLEALLSAGHKVDFHKEQILSSTKLQLDIFLPEHNIAIEIDGPSHFMPVWGEDTLKKNIAYDNKKSGLIIGKGYVLIRIKQLREFSKTRAELICQKLRPIISSIIDQFPDIDKRIIEIGDE